MFTIVDYIKRYKTYTIKEFGWNEIDNLLCAILAYLPVKGFKKTKGLFDIYDEIIRVENIKELGNVEPKTLEILRLILDSNRYRDLKFSNFVKIKNDDTQFGAVTLRLNNITVVSFQGTDYSTVGWLENFRLAYQYPTYTQNLAVNYLKSTLHFLFDNNVYVVGHSKGGNLAMTSVMESSNRIYKKIKKVYNFDGPGFRELEYKTEKYEKLNKKLTNVVPGGSVIGILLNNKNYEIIKTNAVGFSEHYPTNWGISENCFEKGKLSFVSKQLQHNTTVKINEIDENVMKDAIETLFGELNENKTSDIKLSLENIIKIYNSLKLAKQKTLEPLDIIFTSMEDAIYDRN